MKGLLLLHVSVALLVSALLVVGHMPLLALAVLAYAILVALNKTPGFVEAAIYLVAGAFTAGFVLLSVLNFDSGRYFVSAVFLVGLAAAWSWALTRSQQPSIR
jgi:hypothetical protein